MSPGRGLRSWRAKMRIPSDEGGGTSIAQEDRPGECPEDLANSRVFGRNRPASENTYSRQQRLISYRPAKCFIHDFRSSRAGIVSCLRAAAPPTPRAGYRPTRVKARVGRYQM